MHKEILQFIDEKLIPDIQNYPYGLDPQNRTYDCTGEQAVYVEYTLIKLEISFIKKSCKRWYSDKPCVEFTFYGTSKIQTGIGNVAEFVSDNRICHIDEFKELRIPEKYKREGIHY